MNEVIAEPEVGRQISKAAFVIVPRPVEVLRRIKVIAFLNNRPGCALGGILAILLIKISSVFIKRPLDAERINTAPAGRQLKAIAFFRLDVLSRRKKKINCNSCKLSVGAKPS